MTVSPGSPGPSATACARASSAPSMRSWSVIARWLSPRATAARTTAAGEASESKLADVWQCRSTKAWAPATGAAICLEVLDQRLLEEVVVLEHFAGTERDAVERVLGDVARNAGDLGEQLVDVAEQRAAARHDHALVDDVRAELVRRLLEDLADRRDQLLERQLDGLHDLRRGNRDRSRQPGNEIAPANLHRELALEWQGRADRDLDLFGSPLA